MPAAPEGPRARRPSGAAAPAPDLSDLLRRSARGEEEAFGQLYDATARRVYGLVLRVVRDPAMSEEVTQEVYLDVWRTSSRFDPDRGSALSWLLTIAHRAAVDRVRSSEASRRREDAHAAATRGVAFDETAEAAHGALEAQRVRRALGTLTEVQRSAVELAFLGGYTHTEVARLLDLPLGTAKTRIRDGLIRLRDTLGGPA
ncbi:ECF RNA polymerase sigma factor SigK [Phycicoccus endophyticus]|nr:ECF RNA polymerase sigma factor SigK [Phycicoccus endophyticus]GGL44275.1 RNA polymerase sigma factor SigK [Phycicoccus endophyticus]